MIPDRGLGDVRLYPPSSHAGVLVLRLDNQSPLATEIAVRSLPPAIDLDTLNGCIAVYRNGEIRSADPRQPDPRPAAVSCQSS